MLSESTALETSAMNSTVIRITAVAVAIAVTAPTLTAQARYCVQPPFSVAAKPNTPAPGDFNGDGWMDLLVPSGGNNDVQVLIGTGHSFALGTPIPLGEVSQSIAVADFNNDGRADCAVVCPNSASNGLQVFLGSGAAAFSPSFSSSLTGAQFVVAARFNNDSNTDLAVTYGSTDLAVLFGDGAGGFTPAAGSPFSLQADSGALAAADLTGDALADIAAVENVVSGVSVLVNDGTGNFSRTTFAVANRPSDIAIGNINGDAWPDIAIALAGSSPSDDRVEIRLNDGFGNFGTQPTYSPIQVGLRPLSVALVDVDSDSLADLITANHDANTTAVLLNVSGQGFAPDAGSPYPTNTQPYGLAVCDVGSDGYVDVVVGTGPATLDLLVVCCTTSSPTVYCTAKLNSLFCLPSISLGSQPSASAGAGCMLNTVNVIGKKNGLYFHGTAGSWAPLFHGGVLCVKTPLKRHPVLNSGGTAASCNGVLSEDLNAYIATGADPSLVAGVQLWIQGWSRDPGDLFGDSLSDAVTATICP